MTCLEVRELLPEFAVGVLGGADRVEVERHLRWCAGCRKEAADLGSAAATVGFALPPEPVPSHLGDRVVSKIRQVAGAPGTRRRARTGAAAAVAALVAVAGLGWGSVMAGRAERFAARAARAEERQTEAFRDFQHILQGVVPGVDVPEQETFLGQLAPTAAGGVGGGAVLEMVSPTRIDFTFVIVNGLPPDSTHALPYRISLSNAAGEVLRAGRIEQLDADGGAELFHQFGGRDLSGFTQVRVTDADGAVVLAGDIDQTPTTPGS